MSLSIKKPERELSIGEIISKSFNLYSNRFIYFLIPYLFAGLITGILSIAVNLMLPMPPTPELTAPPEELLQWFMSFIATLIAVVALTGFVSWVVNTIVNGIAIKYASDLLEKGDANLQVGFNFTVSRLASLLAAGIITGFLIILGLICLIVPGIIIAIMFALVTPVIMIERKGALDSLGRSRRLVSNRWGKTFGLLLVIYIIIGILSLIVGAIVGVVVYTFDPARTIITNLITALIQPILPIASTFLYYSMAAKESVLAPRPPPPPPAVTPAPTPAQPMKFCLQCGQQIPPDVRFCPYCGKEIEKPP